MIYRAISLFLIGLALVAYAHAATFVVTKIADTNDGICDSDCSLREAIASANSVPSNDTIVFAPSVFMTPQTIDLSGGTISISSAGSLNINGPGTNILRITNPVLDTRHFDVLGNAVVVINGLTISGRGEIGFGGGINVFFDNLTLNEVLMTHNYAQFGAHHAANGAYSGWSDLQRRSICGAMREW